MILIEISGLPDLYHRQLVCENHVCQALITPIHFEFFHSPLYFCGHDEEIVALVEYWKSMKMWVVFF